MCMSLTMPFFFLLSSLLLLQLLGVRFMLNIERCLEFGFPETGRRSFKVRNIVKSITLNYIQCKLVYFELF